MVMCVPVLVDLANMFCGEKIGMQRALDLLCRMEQMNSSLKIFMLLQVNFLSLTMV